MSYRDDLDAAVARADAVDRQNAALVEENQRLATELTAAHELVNKGAVSLGDTRVKIAIVLGVLAAIALGVGGLVYGRFSVTCPECRIAVAPRLPVTIGTMVADGPKVGHWTLNATRCVRRSDGIELTSGGEEKNMIWLTNNVVEVEVPDHDFLLKESECLRHGLLIETNDKVDPPTYSGHVELDCHFGIDPPPDAPGGPKVVRREFDPMPRDNVIQGRIEFQNCR